MCRRYPFSSAALPLFCRQTLVGNYHLPWRRWLLKTQNRSHLNIHQAVSWWVNCQASGVHQTPSARLDSGALVTTALVFHSAIRLCDRIAVAGCTVTDVACAARKYLGLCQTQSQEDAGESCDAENFVHDVSLGDCAVLGSGAPL